MKDKIRKLLFRIFAKEILAATAPPIQIEKVKPIELRCVYIKDDFPSFAEGQKVKNRSKLLESLAPYVEETLWEDRVELSIWVFKRK